MPERKPQFSCQMDEETQLRIRELKERIAASLGLVKLSDPALLRLAMLELEKKYPAAEKPKGGKK